MNLLRLSSDSFACVELKSTAPMSVWLGTSHLLPEKDGQPELVFQRHEVDADFTLVVDKDLNTFGLAPDGWRHARLFNVAINVERFLVYKVRSKRDQVARVLPLHMCLQNGSLRWNSTKLPPTAPQASATSLMSNDRHRKLLGEASIMRSLHDRFEWQLVESPCPSRQPIVA